MAIRSAGILLTLCVALLESAAAARAQPADQPWRRFGPGGDALGTLQRNAAMHAPGSLCSGRAVTTQSPLDKVQLPASAQAQLTPPLAQAAGFVAMVDRSQRDAARSLVVGRLQAHHQWPHAAQDGYFDYLVHEAGVAREKAQAAFGILGGVTGGLGGGLAGMFGHTRDDTTGTTHSLGPQGAAAGSQYGARGAQALRPTEFVLAQSESSIAAVVDAMLDRPCDISATDAIVALKAR